MSYSGKIYQEIRQYLKNGQEKLSQVQIMIDRACQIPEHGGQASKEGLLALYPNTY